MKDLSEFDEQNKAIILLRDEQITRLKIELQQCNDELADLKKRLLPELNRRVEVGRAAQQELENVYNSLSWKITGPIRKLHSLLTRSGKQKCYIDTIIGKKFWQIFAIKMQKKSILVIDRFVPAYDTNSGALRMFTLLCILNDLGYKVTFIPDDLVGRQPYTKELCSRGIDVVCDGVNIENYFVQNGPKFEFVMLSEPQPAFNFMPLVKAYAINSTVIYDTVDLHWIRLERAYAVQNAQELLDEAAWFKKVEMLNMRMSDMIFTVTEDEKRYLKSMGEDFNIAVIPNIHALMDCERKPFSSRKNIMFIGHFLHQPNIDAMKYFVSEIFPQLKVKLPDVKLIIVGSNPTDEILALKSDDIEVTGFVKDVSPFFENCRVFVAPLRFGAGMKGKIGQSMTYGLPVVTTPIGAEGMSLEHETNVLIADSPEQFVDEVMRLYTDELLWEKLSSASMAHIDQHYSKSAISHIIQQALLEAGKVA